jgi:hypothetical protein
MNKGDALKSLGKAFDIPVTDSESNDALSSKIPHSVFKFIKDNFAILTLIYSDEVLMRRLLSYPWCGFVISFKNTANAPNIDQLADFMITLDKETHLKFEFIAVEKIREPTDKIPFNAYNCHGSVKNSQEIIIDGSKTSEPEYVRNLLKNVEEFIKKNFKAYGLIMLFETSTITSNYDDSNAWLIMLSFITGLMEKMFECLELTCFVIGVDEVENDNSCIPRVLRMVKDEK